MRGIHSMSRRAALKLAAVTVLLPVRPRALLAAAVPRDHSIHPVPRKGITGARVATAALLRNSSHLIELFDGVRAIPQVVDGIRCHCGCADLDGHYSLLTCYEGEDAMAKICPICQGMGRVAVRMAKAGRSLDDIRAAVDAQYG